MPMCMSRWAIEKLRQSRGWYLLSSGALRLSFKKIFIIIGDYRSFTKAERGNKIERLADIDKLDISARRDRSN